MQSICWRLSYLKLSSIRSSLDKKVFRRTATVPMLGGFTLPLVIALHMSSYGMSSSDHMTVNRGESQRTMDDGSSNRRIRLFRLGHMLTLVKIKHEETTNVSGEYDWIGGRPLFQLRHCSWDATTYN